MIASQLDKINETYQGKRVFITGHTGFKGSWLLYWLHRLGALVKGYALEPEHSYDLYNQMKGDEFCESVIADVRDRDRLIKEVTDFQPDFVFHLAAQPLVRLSYEIPAETFVVNIIGTSHILDAIRALDKPCVGIMITTDKVYDIKEWAYPYRENDQLGGHDPYSASKACAELVISSYRSSFFNFADFSRHNKAIASARAGNVIGGGDWAKDRIIPDIAMALQKREPVIVRNPHAIRPWQHVLEPLGGYLLLGALLNEDPAKYSQAWNFGPQKEDTLSVLELVKLSIQCWGHGKFKENKKLNSPYETSTLKLDVSLSESQLGWFSKWNVHQAVENTINWYYSSYHELKKPIQLMEKDLMKYITT